VTLVEAAQAEGGEGTGDEPGELVDPARLPLRPPLPGDR